MNVQRGGLRPRCGGSDGAMRAGGTRAVSRCAVRAGARGVGISVPVGERNGHAKGCSGPAVGRSSASPLREPRACLFAWASAAGRACSSMALRGGRSHRTLGKLGSWVFMPPPRHHAPHPCQHPGVSSLRVPQADGPGPLRQRPARGGTPGAAGRRRRRQQQQRGVPRPAPAAPAAAPPRLLGRPLCRSICRGAGLGARRQQQR